jgi:hypothetical protein
MVRGLPVVPPLVAVMGRRSSSSNLKGEKSRPGREGVGYLMNRGIWMAGAAL